MGFGAKLGYKSKEQLEYPDLLFRQIDRTAEILSSPLFDVQQFGRAVDALAAIVFPLGEVDFSPVAGNVDEDDYYINAINTFEKVMEILSEKRLLLRWQVGGEMKQ